MSHTRVEDSGAPGARGSGDAPKPPQGAQPTGEIQQPDVLTTVAAHGLTEPLRTLITYLELLDARRNVAFDAESRDHLRRALETARRMRGQTDALLALSRLDAQRRPFATVDMGEVLDNVIADMAEGIHEAEASVTSGILPHVEGDPDQLGIVLANLVGNAIKFRSDESPRVRVRATTVGVEWVVRVEDNGIGIDRASLKQVFDLFRRLHPADEYEGSGIGLAVCKKIIEGHGGRIWVESTPGQGATFLFTLPRRRPEP